VHRISSSGQMTAPAVAGYKFGEAELHVSGYSVR
jgi:hypothetical protein